MASAKNIKGITIEIEGKTSGLVKALEDANKALSRTKSALKDVNDALKLDPGNADLIRQKQALLADAIEETKKKLEAEKQAAKDAADALARGDISKEQYATLQAEVAKTTKELENLEKQAKDTGSVLGKQFEEAGKKISAVGDKISDVGTSMAKNITGPIVAVGAGAVAAFNEVDGAYDTLIKKTGATGEALEGMQDIVDSLATSMPTTFDEAAQAVGEVNTRFGVTGDDLQTLSEQFLKFAQLNDTDVSSSVDSVQKALAAFGLSAEDAGMMLDTLNAVSQKTGINAEQLSDLMTSNAATLSEMGLNAQQAASFLGEVEVSGADVSQVMSGLQKALKNATDEGVPLDDALANIQKSMKNAGSEADGLAAAYELFGTRAGAAIYNAVQNGSLSFEDLGKAAEDNLGSVSDTFAETQDGIDQLTPAFNALKLAGAELGATIGETLAPILTSLAEGLKGVAEWWETLSPGMQEFIVKAALLAAALGPVILVVGKVVSAIGSITTVIGTLMPIIVGTVIPAIGGVIAALAPFLPIIAAVGAAIAGIILIVKNWSEICDFFSGVWENFTGALHEKFDAAKEKITEGWNDLKSKASDALGKIKTTFEENGGGIKGAVAVYTEAVKGFYKGMFDTLDNLTGGKLSDILGKFKEKFGEIKQAVSDKLGEMVQGALNWGKDLIDNFVQGIKDKIQAVKDVVGTVAQTVRDFIGFSEPDKGPLSNFHTFAPDMIDLFAKGITDNLGTIQGAMTGMADTVAQTDYSGQLSEINNNLAGMGGQQMLYATINIGGDTIDSVVTQALNRNNYLSGGR